MFSSPFIIMLSSGTARLVAAAPLRLGRITSFRTI